MDWFAAARDAASKQSDSAARQAAVRALFADNPDIDVSALKDLTRAQFDELNSNDKTSLDELKLVADVYHAVNAESKTRESHSAATTAPSTASPSTTTAPAPDAGGANAAVATTEPPAPIETIPSAQETPQMDTPNAQAGPEAVAASAGTQVAVLTPAEVLMPWEAMPFETQANNDTSFVITAGAGAPGVEVGEQFNDFERLAKLMAARFEGLSRGMSEPSQMTLASARPEDWSNAYSNIARSGIASLGFTRQHDFVLEHQHDWQTIERACNEARLPGGTLTRAPESLTAAPGTPGWCAPCEPRYDFAPPAVIDGIVDLPTVIAPRGCMTFPVMPDFGLLYAGTGFCYPAADYDAPAPPLDPPPPPGPKNKPCMMVPCPEQQTCTLDPCGICLQSSILIERAYPELIQFFMRQALVAWGHKMNCRDLQMMIAASTLVPTFGPLPLPRAIDTQSGPGAAASILEVVEYYATWMRYKYRLGRNASVEVVFPDWIKGVVRADLSKRMGVNLLDVTDVMIENWLAIRKVRVQFVLGLDEAFCDLQGGPPAVQIDPKTSLKFGGNALALGVGPAPGAAPAMWPETVSFLMYPAGTFFRARMNLVNIEGGLVDSALLKRNERLLLFVEEASTVCKRAYDSLYITINICASGQTGGASTTHPACAVVPEAP